TYDRRRVCQPRERLIDQLAERDEMAGRRSRCVGARLRLELATPHRRARDIAKVGEARAAEQRENLTRKHSLSDSRAGRTGSEHNRSIGMWAPGPSTDRAAGGMP